MRKGNGRKRLVQLRTNDGLSRLHREKRSENEKHKCMTEGALYGYHFIIQLIYLILILMNSFFY